MEWQFSTTKNGYKEGWNSPGLTQFAGNALLNLVRETIQNSLDNPNQDNDENTPVVVKFIEHNVDRNKIPGLENLIEHLVACEKDAKESNENTKQGIAVAISMAKQKKVKILEISDFHTKGMPGSKNDVYTPFYNYMKTSGESLKDDTRTGSHGHGKFAPLVNAKLRTVFVSTLWKEENKKKILFQGTTILSGRQPEKNISIGQRGFWGDKDSLPFEDIPKGYKWMKRDKQGTSIFIIGWDPSQENWDSIVTGFALINYFAAFIRNKLRIHVQKIDAKEVIIDGNDKKFVKYFDNLSIISALKNETENEHKIFQNSKFYVQCLTKDKDIINENINIQPGIGQSRVKLIIDKDAPQKIVLIRNNMLITDKIPYFFQNKHREFENYAGVVEIKNTSGKNLIRSMENPSHTKLSEGQLPTHSAKQNGKKALVALGGALKKIIKKRTSIRSNVSSGPIEILKQFFYDEAGEGGDNIENEDIDPSGKFIRSSEPLKESPPPIINIDDSGIEDDLPVPTPRNKPTRVPKPNPPKDRRKNVDSIKLYKKRVLTLKENTVTALICSDKDITVKITFQEIGADFSEYLKVNRTSEGEVEDGDVCILLKKDADTKIVCECNRNIVGGVKLLIKEGK